MSFFEKDRLLYDLEVEPQDILEQLTPIQIKEILNNLGEDNIDEYDDKFILPTICHNPINSHCSKKLYYYFDNKIFRCYTECGESFNIFTLIQKVLKQQDHSCGLQDAINFILNNSSLEADELSVSHYHSIAHQFRPQKQDVSLPIYSKDLVNMFLEYYTVDWLKENISVEAMKRFNIRYSIWRNKIIIPHYNILGELVGIRGRALDLEEIANGQKYMPVYIEGKFFSHPLSLNLYGIYENQIGIKTYKRAVVFEGEKSVIKHYDWYRDDSIAVAVCGNTINKIQLNLLLRNFQIKELIIGFDKEYDRYGTAESTNYINKLLKIYEKYRNYVDISFLLDRENLLNKKDAPVDQGKEVFQEILNSRMKLK